jgi:hypothetical protein
MSAEEVRVTSRGCSGNPPGLAWRSRQSSIQAHAALCNHKRSSRDYPFVESLI